MAQTIGSVTVLHGTAQADGPGGARALAQDAPVYQGDVVSTGPGSALEIRFADKTVLAQGADSKISLDEYTFDGSGGSLAFKMAQGTFRAVTGQIADKNPEAFQLKSPLATIGIRGTEIGSVITFGPDGAPVEQHAVLVFDGKPVIVFNGGAFQLLTGSGQMVPVVLGPDGAVQVGDPIPAPPELVSYLNQFSPQAIQQQAPQNFTPPPPPDGQNDGQDQGQDQGEDPLQELAEQDQQVLQEVQEDKEEDEDDGQDDGQNTLGLDDGDEEEDEEEQQQQQQPPQQQQGSGSSSGGSGDSGGQEATPYVPPTPQEDNDPVTPIVVITLLDLSAKTGMAFVNLGTSPQTAQYYEGGDMVETTFSGVTEVIGTPDGNEILGSAAAETLTGGAGDDSLNGYCGNDSLTGNGGNDFLWGGDGDDVLNMGSDLGSSDVVDGGDGEDTLKYTDTSSESGAELSGVSNVEYIELGHSYGAWLTLPSTLLTSGTLVIDASGLLTLEGQGLYLDGTSLLSSVDLYVIGSGYDDTILAGGGDDTLLGGTGNDVLNGGDGDNFYLPGPGNDQVTGGSDTDLVNMQTYLANPDTLSGGAGQDTLAYTDATAAADDLDHVTGFETIVATGAVSATFLNTLVGSGQTLAFNAGGAASLVLDASAETDGKLNILGSGGNDSVIRGGISADDTINGGAGNDTLSADSSAYTGLDNVTGFETLILTGDIALVTTQDALVAAGKTLTVTGAALAEGLEFNGSAETNGKFHLTGSDGSDCLTGGAGNDTLVGGVGGDYLDGSQGGDDSILGGADSDLFVMGEALTAGDTLDGGAGGNSLDFTAVSGTSLANVSNMASLFILGEANCTLTARSDLTTSASFDVNSQDYSGNLTFNASAIAAGHGLYFIGGSGDDSITGTQGADSINTGAGADTLVATLGADTLDGGDAGANLVTYASLSKALDVTYSTSSSLSVDYTYGGTVTQTLIDIQNLILSGQNDSVTAEGNLTSANMLDGGAGADTLSVTTSSDVLGIRNFEVLNVEHDGMGPSSVASVTLTDNALVGTSLLTVVMGTAVDYLIFTGAAESTGRFHVTGTDEDINNSITGTDTIAGGGGADTLLGLSGDDFLAGNAGADQLFGGDGADTLHGGLGNDLLNGGNNDVSLYQLDIAVYADGTSGVNVNLGTGLATGGGLGTDTLTGIEGVVGSGFADTLSASATAEASWFQGGAGNDLITGAVHDEDANVGWDVLSFRDGLVTGVTVTFSPTSLGSGTATGAGLGTDTFSKIDEVWGTDQDDSLYGSHGEQYFEGFAGNDILDGGFTATQGYDDEWDGVTYRQSISGVVVNLSANDFTSGSDTVHSGTALDGWGGTDTLSHIEEVTGSMYADTILGADDQINYITGLEGSDSLVGGSGDFHWNVVCYDVDPNGVFVNLSSEDYDDGSHFIYANAAFDGWGNTDSLYDFDGIIGSAHDDLLVGSENGTWFQPGEGDDTVVGGNAMDVLSFAESDQAVDVTDTSASGQGEDTLEGIEVIQGSDYDDTITSSGVITSMEGMDGDDSLTAFDHNTELTYQNSPGSVLADLTTGLAGSDGWGGEDIITGFHMVYGSAYGDTITGSATDDSLFGNEGGDSLFGAGGADLLYGEDGNDTLSGGDGNDIITGGAGSDVLAGGDGDDIFRYDAGTECGDSITDFTTGADSFLLYSPDFAWIDDSAWSDMSLYSDLNSFGGEAGFAYVGNTLYFDADGVAGDEQAVATLTSGTLDHDDLSFYSA